MPDEGRGGWLKTARAAHRAMVAGFAAGLHRAFLFALEELDQFGDRGLFDSESSLTRMLDRGIEVSEPRRLRGRNEPGWPLFPIRV